MIQPFDIEFINNELLSRFGKYCDRQKYRVVWSDAQIESRLVDHHNGIYYPIPRVEETRKYSYIKERWIMEIWVPHASYKDVVTMDGGTYEAIWTFQDKAGNPLRPVWKACEILALAAEGRFFVRRTEKDDAEAHEAAILKDVEEFEAMLEPSVDYGNQKVNYVKPVYLAKGEKNG